MSTQVQRDIEYQVRVDCSKGAQGVRILTLDEGQNIVIGRMTSPQDVSTATALKFDSKVISRKHAILSIIDKKLCIKDTQSSSGTFLNGQRLSSQAEESDYIELITGDEVALGEDCDVDGVLYQRVFLKLTLARFEGEIKKGGHDAPARKTISREEFNKIVKQTTETASTSILPQVPVPAAATAAPAQSPHSSIQKSEHSAAPVYSPIQIAKWGQIKSRLEKGLTESSKLGRGESILGSEDFSNPLKGSGSVNGEFDELSADQVAEMNAEFDQIWANVSNGLDGKLSKYLKLAEPFCQIMLDSGAIPRHVPFIPKKYKRPDVSIMKKGAANLPSSYSLATSDNRSTGAPFQ